MAPPIALSTAPVAPPGLVTPSKRFTTSMSARCFRISPTTSSVFMSSFPSPVPDTEPYLRAGRVVKEGLWAALTHYDKIVTIFSPSGGADRNVPSLLHQHGSQLLSRFQGVRAGGLRGLQRMGSRRVRGRRARKEDQGTDRLRGRARDPVPVLHRRPRQGSLVRGGHEGRDGRGDPRRGRHPGRSVPGPLRAGPAIARGGMRTGWRSRLPPQAVSTRPNSSSGRRTASTSRSTGTVRTGSA